MSGNPFANGATTSPSKSAAKKRLIMYLAVTFALFALNQSVVWAVVAIVVVRFFREFAYCW